MPVEVVGIEGGHDHDAGSLGDVEGLEARRLDDEEIEVIGDVGIEGRTTDVARHLHVQPRRLSEVTELRMSGRLPQDRMVGSLQGWPAVVRPL